MPLERPVLLLVNASAGRQFQKPRCPKRALGSSRVQPWRRAGPVQGYMVIDGRGVSVDGIGNGTDRV